MLIKWFSVLSSFDTTTTNLSWNKSLNINIISYFEKTKDILIFKMTNLTMPMMNQSSYDCINGFLFWNVVKKITKYIDNILIFDYISYFKKLFLKTHFQKSIKLLQNTFMSFLASKNRIKKLCQGNKAKLIFLIVQLNLKLSEQPKCKIMF